MPLPLVHYKDDHLLVVEKPEGLLSVPGRGPDNQDCLITRVQATWPDVLTVHRLDMATSGLVVIARGGETQRRLSMAFAARQVEKRYIAVVAGQVAADDGEIDLPLITDWPNRPRQMIDHTIGKPSQTRYRALERNTTTTRVELEPMTGRSHQLRVHMMAIGHPILGDVFYAPADILDLSPRLMLHAQRLSFVHPVAGAPLDFVSDVPF